MAEPAPSASAGAHPQSWRWEGKGPHHFVFKRLILLLPLRIQYFLTLIAFWPTAIIARLYAYFFPHKRRVWDRIDNHVILGAAPFLRNEMETLYHKEKVRRVINMCAEWDWHRDWYRSIGIEQLWLPVVDFNVPEFEDLVAGALFIHDGATNNSTTSAGGSSKGSSSSAAGATTYVHCKAGRSRSTAVVLAYLILFKGMEPEEAHRFIKSKRQHINERHKAAEVQRCWALRQELMTGGHSLQSYEAMLRRIASRGDTEVLKPRRSHQAADADAAKNEGLGAKLMKGLKGLMGCGRAKKAKEGKLA